jgi:hypothetical protein
MHELLRKERRAEPSAAVFAGSPIGKARRAVRCLSEMARLLPSFITESARPQGKAMKIKGLQTGLGGQRACARQRLPGGATGLAARGG